VVGGIDGPSREYPDSAEEPPLRSSHHQDLEAPMPRGHDQNRRSGRRLDRIRGEGWAVARHADQRRLDPSQ
jgi:hypothetical protein